MIRPSDLVDRGGETWNFQFWYRDPLIPALPYNVSNGLSVPFTP